VRIVLRTDSSSVMGMGHVSRCLTLANELSARGHDIIFVCREHPGNWISKLEEALYPVCRLPVPKQTGLKPSEHESSWLGVTIEQDALETMKSLPIRQYDWCIVDHYGLDAAWEQQVRKIAKRILVIDDLANRNHDCDILLDQNYFGTLTQHRYRNKVPNFCQCLYGPEHALLQPIYPKLRRARADHDGQIHRVLVFFGGSDLSDETSKTLHALDFPAFSHLKVDVVVGKNYPNLSHIKQVTDNNPNLTLYQNIPSLAPLMAQADLVIGAGGTTTWERMSLGLPAIIICIAENQQQGARILAEEGFQFLLQNGKKTSIDEWRQAIFQLLNDPALVKKISKKVKLLVDGAGVRRVAQSICGESVEYSNSVSES